MESQSSRLFKLLSYPSGDVLRGEEIYKKIKNFGVENLSFVSKGYRGIVFKGELNGRKVAVKVPRSDVKKENFLLKECEVLRYLSEKLGEKNPAPFPFGCSPDFLVMEWIEGIPFSEAFKRFGLDVILGALRSCFLLDESGVEHCEIKGEKHLIYNGRKVRIIDFESAKFKDSPRNLLQFFGYHVLGKGILELDKGKVMELLNLYKVNRDAGYRALVSLLTKGNSCL